MVISIRFCASTQLSKGHLVRLACLRHAASVHPEPGSNSPKKYFKKLITATQIDVLLSFQRTKFSFVLPFLSDTVINISFFIFNVKCFFEVF